MKALLVLALVGVLVGGGLKLAGIPIPFLDYAVGPMGGDRPPGLPEIEVEAPGFDEFDAP